ncbi:MAG: hypothetical protein ABFS12_06955 [Bacteroidota bacterium]
MESNQIQEDIQYIKKMIENNRHTLVDNGLSYIINGLIVAIGIPLTILMGYNGFEQYIPYVWLLLIAVMIFANLIANKKIEKKNRVKTFGSELFGAVWGACGLSIIIIFILSFSSIGMGEVSFFMSISGILAIGYFLTGVINDLKFMKVLAALWWLTSIISGLWLLFSTIQYLNFFFSFMVLVLQLIPATIIYKKWKRVYNG